MTVVFKKLLTTFSIYGMPFCKSCGGIEWMCYQVHDHQGDAVGLRAKGVQWRGVVEVKPKTHPIEAGSNVVNLGEDCVLCL